MGKKYKIVYDRDGCIGAFACVAVNPEHWIIAEKENKVDLVNSIKVNEHYELIIDEQDLQKLKDAAEVCPVNVIKIFDLETNQEVK